MASVSGLIRFNEAEPALGDIRRHLFGARRLLNWSAFAAAVALYVGIRVFWPRIPFWRLADYVPGLDPWNGNGWADRAAYIALRLFSESYWVALVAMVIAVLLWSRLNERLSARFARKLAGPDDPGRLTSLTIAEDSLTYQDAGVTSVAEWASVVDLFPSHGYWVFLLISQPFVIPRRFFADEVSERAFIAEALSHMSEPARARSKDAVKFVEGTKI